MAERRITDFFGPPAKRKLHESSSNMASLILESVPSPSTIPDQQRNPQHQSVSVVATPAASSSSESRAVLVSEDCEGTSKGAEWYKGHKLNVEWLCNSFYGILEKVSVGKRSGLKCKVCCSQINEAKKFSRNGQVPMADGVRSDGVKELKRVVDHLQSDAHRAALRVEEAQRQWMLQSDKHPWVMVLKKNEAEMISSLIELAIDVHNDSRQMTLSANSWPSRSLSRMHATNQISAYREHGLESTFAAFNPPSTALHYRDPKIYRQMLDCVAEVIMEGMVQEVKDADCFSLQVDGSVDKYSTDNLFITARFINKNKEMINVFLGESYSSKRGAEGLLDALINNLEQIGLKESAKEKLTSLTTDGESANTGRKSGLWVLLKTFLSRDIHCLWCVAHRTDLAFSDIETSVMEVRHWRSNVKAIAAFYRNSAIRMNELKEIAESLNSKFVRFPEHFEIRFIEHLVNLCNAVWKNLPSLRIHWQRMLGPDSRSTRGEIATARGFLRLWEPSGPQEYYTALMLDVLHHFEKLQKACQRSMITVCDVMVAKQATVDALTLMESGPFPGGEEWKILKTTAGTAVECMEADAENTETRRRNHSLVTVKRSSDSVKFEIVQSAKEFLLQRLCDDQNVIVKNMKNFLAARTAKDMIECCIDTVVGLFGEEHVMSFSEDVLGHFASENLPVPTTMQDDSAKLFHCLKISVLGSTFSKLVQSYLSWTPNSIAPERAVSCHTLLKSAKQSTAKRETINSRMQIALNETGTAHFDPRPAVARFLMKKERRYAMPDKELYQNHFFTKKFFAKDSTL